jgi:pyruvate dehydrogenase E1 component alpha subunit
MVMGLRVEKGSAVSEIYRKACAFDMYSERVDGTDVLAVRDASGDETRTRTARTEPR